MSLHIGFAAMRITTPIHKKNYEVVFYFSFSGPWKQRKICNILLIFSCIMHILYIFIAWFSYWWFINKISASITCSKLTINIRGRCEICSKLLKTPEWCWWCCSVVFIITVNFEQVNVGWDEAGSQILTSCNSLKSVRKIEYRMVSQTNKLSLNSLKVWKFAV